MLAQGQTRWNVPPLFVMPHSFLLDPLADALLAGDPNPEILFERCCHVLGRRWRWIGPLTRRYLEKFGSSGRPRRREVIQFLRADLSLQRALARHASELTRAEITSIPQQMISVGATGGWGLPAIDSTGDLAKWLGVSPMELRWFADLKGFGYKSPQAELRHYHYRILAKRFGSVRLIEAPKPRLKDLQLQILRWILEKIPPHPSVHGFVRGRSIKTFVAPHVGKRVVLRMDLRDFFPTFGGVRIQNLFRTFGYPESVADLLGGVCTNATPRDVWAELPSEINVSAVEELRRLYARAHLPQGAPSSPMLANLCCYRMDCRLSAFAKASDANYTRYADDLAFSGGEQFERSAERFAVHVAAILREEGFRVHQRKTRVMRQGVRQHLAGLVTNQRMNVPQKDFDRLKAVLTNCVRHGPGSQNREGLPYFRAHLEGRVGFVESVNPERGKRLRDIFQRIHWE